MIGDWASGPLRPITIFRSQVDNGDDSRPDLEGQDPAGIPVVIFESKFWAGLTDAQPVSYIRRLQQHGGILCFVAPTSRLRFLWPEVTQRATNVFGALQYLRNDPELKTALVGKNCVLAITSWGFLLGQIRTALETYGDSSLVADIRQLMGLASKMDRTGFVPFSVTDLTAPTARQVVQFCDIVNAVVESLLQEPFASKKGLKASAGQGWYGQYFRLHSQFFQLSFNAPMWAEYGRSALWLCAFSRTWQYSEAIERAVVEHFGADACVGLRSGYRRGVWMPLTILEGREFDPVVEHIHTQVVSIATVLSHAAPAVDEDGLQEEAELG